jgi:hypothetical protein
MRISNSSSRRQEGQRREVLELHMLEVTPQRTPRVREEGNLPRPAGLRMFGYRGRFYCRGT